MAGTAVGVVALATLALARLEPAAPTVERSTIWVDTVRQGTMVRQVRSPGNLVPEHIRYITTLTPGRVERILVRPGTAVEAGTVLMELGNPDVHIQALQADQQLTAAEAQLVSLRTTLEGQRLSPRTWRQAGAPVPTRPRTRTGSRPRPHPRT